MILSSMAYFATNALGNMMINEYIGIAIATVGLVFSLAGIIVIYAYKGFYIKAATTSLIDSMGFIMILAF